MSSHETTLPHADRIELAEAARAFAFIAASIATITATTFSLRFKWQEPYNDDRGSAKLALDYNFAVMAVAVDVDQLAAHRAVATWTEDAT